MTKVNTASTIVVALIMISCVCKAQIKPKTTIDKNAVYFKEVHYETLNSCDSSVLGLGQPANSTGMFCYSAYPPVYSGDELLTSQYSVVKNNIHSAISTPVYDSIPFDNTNVRAITKGERLAISIMLVAIDSIKLVDVLKNIEVQVLMKNGPWVTRSTLNQPDYEVSNKRSYSYSCPPVGYNKYMSDFNKFDVISQVMLSGSRLQQRTSQRPSPYLSENNLMSPEFDTYMPTRPSDPERPDRVPEIDMRDERALKEMSDYKMKKAIGSLESWMDNSNSCPKKTLKYFWTDIYYEYTPDLNETQIRFHINSDLAGPDNIILTQKFNVYLAVAYRHEMPQNDGQRKYNFAIKTSGNLNLSTLKASVLYNETALYNTPSTQHRTFATFGTPSFYPEYNLTVNGCNGIFPFRKNYYDDVAKTDINEFIKNADDINPIEIKGNQTLAYQIQIISTVQGNVLGLPFFSKAYDFDMPQPITFALMGDSYSAGEGAPVLSGTNWLDDNCHRSKNSGLYRAVNRFIKNSSKVCDYTFVACSGAEIQDIIFRTQRADNTSASSPIQNPKSQSDSVKGWMLQNNYVHLNCAIFSIGGNNSGFAKIIKAGLISVAWDGTRSEKNGFHKGMEYINGPNGYNLINIRLKEKLNVHDVIIMGYPDVVHGLNESVCNSDCPSPDDLTNTIQKSELEFGEKVLTSLNDAESSAASHYNWHFVDIFSATKNHGICICNDCYYTTFKDANPAFLREYVAGTSTYSFYEIKALRNACGKGAGKLSIHCSFHPNERGYRQYITPILDSLNVLYGN